MEANRTVMQLLRRDPGSASRSPPPAGFPSASPHGTVGGQVTPPAAIGSPTQYHPGASYAVSSSPQSASPSPPPPPHLHHNSGAAGGSGGQAQQRQRRGGGGASGAQHSRRGNDPSDGRSGTTTPPQISASQAVGPADAPLLRGPTIPGHNALRSVAIRTLPKLLTGNLIIVGDIHGCLEQFDALLAKTNFRQGIDCLLLVGDLVNKGPESIGVVQRAMQLGAFAVLGNHDYTLLELVERHRKGELPRATDEEEVDPVAECARDFPDECYNYLIGLPHIIKVPQYNLLVVHAGLNVQEPDLRKQKMWDLMHIRRILRDGTCQERGDEGSLWARLWGGPEVVIFGHDARTGFQDEAHAIGLDTGCVYGGPLTAVLYPGRRFVSVPGLPSELRPRAHKRRPAASTGEAEAQQQLQGGRDVTPAGLVGSPAAFPATPAGPTQGPGAAAASSSAFATYSGGSVLTSSSSLPGLKLASGKVFTPSSSVLAEGGSQDAAFPRAPPPAHTSAPARAGVVPPAAVHAGVVEAGLMVATTTAVRHDRTATATPSGAQAASATAALLRETRRDAVVAVTGANSIFPLVSLLTSPSFEEHWEDILEDTDVPAAVWGKALLTLIRESSQVGVKPVQCLGLVQDIANARDDVLRVVAADAMAAFDEVELTFKGVISKTILQQTRVALRPHGVPK